MLRNAFSPKMSPGMLRSVPRSASRSVSIITVALVGTLWAHAARAQEAADLVTRIGSPGGGDPRAHRQCRAVAVPQPRARAASRAACKKRPAGRPPPPQQPPGGAYPPPPGRTAAVAGIPRGASLPPSPPEQVPPAAPGRRGERSIPTPIRTRRGRRARSAPARRRTSRRRSTSAPRRCRIRRAPRLALGAPLDLSSSPQGAAPPGALPPPPPRTPSSTGAMQATLPPSNTPKDEYDLAYGYVLHTRLRARGRDVPRVPAPISERPHGAGSAVLAGREPVPAAAISRGRRVFPRRVDQIRRDARGRRMRCCGSASRSRRWAKKKPPAPRSARCCANIRAPRST